MTESALITPLPLAIGLHTDVGQHRSHNEDAVAVIDLPGTQAAFILCDGMGGLRAGDVASREAVRSVASSLNTRFSAGHVTDPLEALSVAFTIANDAVNGLHTPAGSAQPANQDADSPTERAVNGPSTNALMGTTCVAAVIRNNTLYLAHAGDSRAYLYRDGSLVRLTDDHSYVAERVRAGDITEAEARISRFRNMITRAIGIDMTVDPELRQESLKEGDTILACSDGLTTMIDDAQIADILRSNPLDRVPPDRIAQLLGEAANRAGGSDNITVVVLRAGGVGDSPAKVAAATGLPAGPAATPAPPKPVAQPAKKIPVAAPPPARPSPPAFASADSRPPGAIVDIDSPPPTWKPRRPGAFSLTSFLFGAALAIGSAIALFAISADARQETARVLRGLTPVEAATEQRITQSETSNLTNLVYDAPARFSDILARGDVLGWSRDAGLYCAGAESGTVMSLDPKTGKLARTAVAALPVPKPSANSSSDRVYFAADRSGDVYLSSPRAKTLEKRGPDGKVLVTLRGFARPEAVAVDDDGNLYVVDFNLVKVLRAHDPSSRGAGASAAPEKPESRATATAASGAGKP